MNEIRFYHLQKSRLEEALPQLLERTLSKGWRAVVKASSAERVEQLNGLLWTYSESSFLPHGSSKDGDAALQPVWLTESDENPNKANVLMLVDGAAVEGTPTYELTCLVFDGTDPEALAQARGLWKSWQGSEAQLTYWKQEPQGWVKQAL
jgi:DNA polymerase III subunit chi